MKKILCIVSVCALLLLSSCNGSGDFTHKPGTYSENTSSSTVSYLDSSDSDTAKYLNGGGIIGSMNCSLKITRKNETGIYDLAIVGNRFYVACEEKGEKIAYYYDSEKTYRFFISDKTAQVVKGTEPYAVTLAKSFSAANLTRFLRKGTEQYNLQTYKYEEFAVSDTRNDRICFYLKDDNSIAYIIYKMGRAEDDVLLEVVSMDNQPDKSLFAIPSGYSVVE